MMKKKLLFFLMLCLIGVPLLMVACTSADVENPPVTTGADKETAKPTDTKPAETDPAETKPVETEAKTEAITEPAETAAVTEPAAPM